MDRSRVPHPARELVGRDRERAAIARALDALAHGRRAALAFIGEIGIGKTRLLDELIDAAGGEPLVLAGRAAPYERQVRFALVVAALEAHGPEPAGDPVRAAAAARSELERLAQRRPVVLVLDDVQWADRASLDVVADLIGGRPDAPLLVALASRPRRFAGPFGAALRSGALRAIRPRRLDEAQVGELLGERVDRPAVRAVHRRAGGNPLVVRELTYDVDALPASIAAAIDDELADLGREARALLQAAAVVGDGVDLQAARAVAELSEERARSALEELVDRGLIVAPGGGSPPGFPTPVHRQAVYASAGAGWRIRAHRRAAVVLAARGGSLDARAHHHERSAEPGDEEAIAVLRRAGRARVGTAPAAAATWTEAALRLLPDGGSPSRRDLLLMLAQARAALGLEHERRAALAQASALVRDDDDGAGGQAEVVLELARLDHDRLRSGEVRAALRDELSRRHDRRTAARLHVELAADHWLAGDLEAVGTQAARAAELVEAADDAVTRAEAHAFQALGDGASGSTAQGRRALELALRAVDALPDARLHGRERILLVVARAALAAECPDRARPVVLRGLRLSRRAGSQPWRLLLHVALAEVHVWHGRLAKAERTVAWALERAAPDASPALASAWALRSWVARLRGDLPWAVAAAERALALARRRPTPVEWIAGSEVGAALIASGDVEAGRRELLVAAGGPALARLEPAARTRWFEVLATADLRAGRPHEAEAWAIRCEASARPFEPSVRTAVALRARAAVLLARDDHAGAARRAADAAARFDEAGAALDAALARLVLGGALRRAGRRQPATHALRSAHTTFEALGALRERDRAARELRLLGDRVVHRAEPQRQGRGALSLLSRREGQVARLAAAGRTNRAIAAELFLSEKTIETYLARAFAKLGVSSRTALARALHDAGPAED
jgi:DNA-binding NarL/FixJ family response regulator